MNVCVIGTGYVGLVTGTCFAEMGNNVICVDIDEKKITDLKNGIMPIFEPGLKEMVHKNSKEQRLLFTTDLDEAVEKALIIFIAVGTPPGEDGSADLKYVLKVAENIGDRITSFKVVVNKSTVPVGTADKVRQQIKDQLDARKLNIEFDVVSNPEFLKEGAAIKDFLTPDRVVIGADNVRTLELMKELYSPFVRDGYPIIEMDVRSAEMTKYAANALLATRISFMNEIANICEKVGADVTNVRTGVGSDSRLGYRYLYPGVGYGGSCFPKDVKALARFAKECGFSSTLIDAVEEVNDLQKMVLVEKIKKRLGNDLSGFTFAVWGLSFKPLTDDMREAPSLTIINALIAAGAKIQAYDPEAEKEARHAFGDNPSLSYAANNYDALDGADALIIITEWKLFRFPDFERINTALKKPLIFDGRNIFNPKQMRSNGFEYISIGRADVLPAS